MTFHNGNRCTGTWKDNKIVGRAAYTLPTGAKYSGSIQDGKFECRALAE